MIKEKPRHLLAVLAGLLALTFTAPALAQNALGNVLDNFGSTSGNIQPIMDLMMALAFVLGLGMTGSGLYRLKDSADRGERAAGDGLMRITGGVLMVSVAPFIRMGLNTFFAGDMPMYGEAGGGTATAGSVTDCLAATGTNAATCVAKNVALNVVPVFTNVSFMIIMLIGVSMVIHAFYSMALMHSQGQRALPKGWAARLIIGIIISNLPAFIYSVQETLGISVGDATIQPNGFYSASSLLSYSAPGGVAALAQYAELIKWLFHIFVMFGLIAVWRGIFLLRAYADGSGQSSLGAGLTHIVGGVFLANAKWTTCILTNTLIGAGATLGFC